MFHGPLGRSDGLEVFVRAWGAEVQAFDLEISLDHDLADDALWTTITDKIDQDYYAAGGGGAPCSSFSASRNANDGGPWPLRGEWPPELYGVKNLTPEENATVRLGTLLALRKAEAFGKFYAKNLPCWAETPARRPGNASVFNLP